MKSEEAKQKVRENDFDCFLNIGTSNNSNLYYLTDFKTTDPITYLNNGEETVLLVSEMETNRARKESSVEKVLTKKDLEMKESEDPVLALIESYDSQSIAVPESFPVSKADKLREENFELEVIKDVAEDLRAIKTDKELEKLENVQKITENAMKKAEELIKSSKVRNNELYLNNEPLTSERIKNKLKVFLMNHNCYCPEGLIVANGKDSADPHDSGEGVLKAGEPIVVDIFPRQDSFYFGDMTRTFAKSSAKEKLKSHHRAVLEAQKTAFEYLETGEKRTAEGLHNSVCSYFEKKGYGTARNGDETGFIHSTGHGVGLELHENPGLGRNNTELKPGMVVTIEPGLYHPDFGGVRIEDMIVITEEGFENFNEMDKGLILD